jgi:nitroreductase
MLGQLVFSFVRHLPGYARLRCLRDWVRGLRNYAYDFRRFSRHSSALSPQLSATGRFAKVTKAYHMLEKGLALPQPRPGFGQGYADEPVGFLLDEVPALEAAGLRGVETQGARAAMRAYVAWHDARGHHLDPRVRTFGSAAGDHPGGTRHVDRADLWAKSGIDFEAFVRTRHSVRNFTGAPVSPDAIRQAVSVALKSPRVCNRESRRVHIAFEPEQRARMLACQNGNRGFGHLAGAVLMITSDLSYFVDFGERNQCWIDGGLFAMTLAYALHAQGLGACMLNASNTHQRDARLRQALKLSENEVVIMFLAVGHLPPSLEVAASPTPQLDDVIKIVDS